MLLIVRDAADRLRIPHARKRVEPGQSSHVSAIREAEDVGALVA